MGTYMRTCAEKRTSEGWMLSEEAVFLLPSSHTTHDAPQFSPAPFCFQHYGMFSLFADIRNDSGCPSLSVPRGFPEDISDNALQHLVPEILQLSPYYIGWTEVPLPETVAGRLSMVEPESYGHSWLSAAELLAFDYDRTFSCRDISPPQNITFRAFLGRMYFIHLETLRVLNATHDMRLLFCFAG
ncbi:hypothetical protein [Pantoea stewartii]|uniref:hypothetical protein n=1 Tax=Pantoea stewartii TaxID=66269 RepID=UPI00345C31C4